LKSEDTEFQINKIAEVKTRMINHIPLFNKLNFSNLSNLKYSAIYY